MTSEGLQHAAQAWLGIDLQDHNLTPRQAKSLWKARSIPCRPLQGLIGVRMRTPGVPTKQDTRIPSHWGIG
jgi:hypothetical protein